MDKISRFEVIDSTGRRIVYYGEARYSLQDEGRTLKVFAEGCVTISFEDFPDALFTDINNGFHPVTVFRKYRRLKQKELAQLISLSESYMSYIEDGKSGSNSLHVYVKIARALNVPLELLVSHIENFK